jgi:hypothetical protein
MEPGTSALPEDGTIDRLLHQSHYTPEDLSQVTGIGKDVILQAVHTGELRAFVVNHHCLDILREDVLTWLVDRDTVTRVTWASD